MKGKGTLKMKLKKVGSMVLATTLCVGTIFSYSTPVWAEEVENETVNSLEDISGEITKLEQDVQNFETQTDALGMIYTIYQAAVEDLKESLDQDEATEGKNMELLIPSIEAGISSVQGTLDTAKETEASESEIANLNAKLKLHNTYIDTIKSLQKVLGMSISDPDIYDILIQSLVSKNPEATGIKLQYEDLKANYDGIVADIQEFESNHSADGIGLAGEENGTPVVYINGTPYAYDKDGGESREISDGDTTRLCTVYSAEDGFEFYLTLDCIHVISGGSTVEAGDYSNTLGEMLILQKDRLSAINKKFGTLLEVQPKLETQVDKLNKAIEEIDLGLDEEAIQNISVKSIALIEKYASMKKTYVTLKSAIYNSAATAELLETLDVDATIKNLGSLSTDLEAIQTEITEALTNSNLSSKDIVALNNYSSSLNTVKSNIDEDISIFNMVKNSGDTANEVSDLLKRIELLEKSNADLKKTSSSSSNASLTNQVKTLTSQLNTLKTTNSSLNSKVSSLTSSNSSLTSQLNSLKSSTARTATSTTSGTSTKTATSTATGTTSLAKATTTASSTPSTATSTTKLATNATTTRTSAPTATVSTGITSGFNSIDDSDDTAVVSAVTSTVASNDTSVGDIPSTFDSSFTGSEVADIENFQFDTSEEPDELTSQMYTSGDNYAADGTSVTGSAGSLEKNTDNVVLIVAVIIAVVLLLGVTGLAIWFFKFRKKSILDEFDDDEDEDDEDMELMTGKHEEELFGDEVLV